MVMNRLLIHPQPLCNPVLRDAKAIHSKYFETFASPGDIVV